VSKVKVGFVQTRPVFGRVRENVESAIRKISGLSADGGIVVLPELFSTGYQFTSRDEAFRYAEDAKSGYTVKRLVAAAKKGSLHIVAGICEKAGKKVYNSSVLVGPDGVRALYRKAHLFSDEKNIFSRGNTRFRVHDVAGVKVGMMICYDWIYPEAARTLALKGASIICHPSNLVLRYCPPGMVTRCLENGVFAVTANRVGSEQRVKGVELKFIGSSQVVAPDGRVLARASSDKVEARVLEIDTAATIEKAVTPLNRIFEDRRPSLYDT